MALSAGRNAPVKGDTRVTSFKVAASTTIYKGGMVAVDADGWLIPAADSAGIAVVGVADETVDNSAGADGAKSCLVLNGVIGMNAGSTAPTQANIGRSVVVEDDEAVTTAAAATNDIPAGTLMSIEGTICYIKTPLA